MLIDFIFAFVLDKEETEEEVPLGKFNPGAYNTWRDIFIIISGICVGLLIVFAMLNTYWTIKNKDNKIMRVSLTFLLAYLVGCWWFWLNIKSMFANNMLKYAL